VCQRKKAGLNYRLISSIPRLPVDGRPLHIVQSGHNRAVYFFEAMKLQLHESSVLAADR
jgi:hypothetical protein